MNHLISASTSSRHCLFLWHISVRILYRSDQLKISAGFINTRRGMLHILNKGFALSGRCWIIEWFLYNEHVYSQHLHQNIFCSCAFILCSMKYLFWEFLFNYLGGIGFWNFGIPFLSLMTSSKKFALFFVYVVKMDHILNYNVLG